MRKKRVSSLTIGGGVSIEDISSYVEWPLVEHARGQHLSLVFLKKWETTSRGSKVSSPPKVTKLMKGWFVFPMSSKEEVDMFLEGMWEMAGVPIVLRKRSPIFYAS